VAYAETVTKPGFYLGVLDIALLARRREKDILILYYDDEFKDVPTVKNLSQILGAIFPDAEVQGQKESPKPEHATAWCLASLMANYERGSFRQLNHFVPLFVKASMGEAMWETVAEKSLVKMVKRVRTMEETKPDTDDDSEDELAESHREYLMSCRRQLEFVQLMMRLDFHVGIVPSDGNCALWSLLALEGGPCAKAQMSSKADVQKLREDPYLTWPMVLLQNAWFYYVLIHWHTLATKCMSI